MSTISINGKDMSTALATLIFAKGALRILSYGMTMRGVNVTKIKRRLAQEGISLKGRTAVDCLAEVESILDSVK